MKRQKFDGVIIGVETHQCLGDKMRNRQIYHCIEKKTISTIKSWEIVNCILS